MTHSLWRRIRSEAKLWRNYALPGVVVIAAIVLARSLGWLQPLEWIAFDRLLLLRPAEPLDDRIVIVGINESDIRKLKTYPVPDGEIATAIAKIQQYKPIAIGLDIFRDLPVEPGHQKLTQLFRSSPNLFAIEQILSGRTEFTVSPPAMLPPEQVGFADAVLDSDGYLRRSLLGSADPNNSSNFKFSLTARLADAYLQATRKLELTKGSENNPDAMQFGSTTLTQFLSNSGSYVGADAGGYQVLLNFRSGQHPFRILSLSDLKAGKFQPDWIRGHIVLIGVTALSVKDVVNSAAIPSSQSGFGQRGRSASPRRQPNYQCSDRRSPTPQDLGRRLGNALDCGLGTVGNGFGTDAAIALADSFDSGHCKCGTGWHLLWTDHFWLVGASRASLDGVGLQWGRANGCFVLQT